VLEPALSITIDRAETWSHALAGEHMLLLPARAAQASRAMRQPSSQRPRKSGIRQPWPRTPSALKWLVVSDSVQLKRKAQDSWPAVACATGVVPTQVGTCDTAPAAHRANVLHTVAELFLLAESTILILGRSRFALAALLLSVRCVLSLHVHLDRSCSRRGMRRAMSGRPFDESHFEPRQLWTPPPPLLRLPIEWESDGSGSSDKNQAELLAARNTSYRYRRWVRGRALLCVGNGFAYSARRLHEADGTLVNGDGFLDNF